MSHEIQEVEVDESQEAKREDLELYRPERVKIEEATVDIVASISDYQLIRTADGGFALTGHVTNHPIREFDPNVRQQTSAIKLFDESQGIAVTENTGYKLVNRLGEPPLKVTSDASA